MMWAMIRKCFVPLCIFLLIFANQNLVHADRGLPGSPGFGIGGAIYLDGSHFQKALEAAAYLELDWVQVPLSWAALQPDPNLPPHYGRLDDLIRFAGQQNIAVLISLTGAPAWAKNELGPDPVKTAQFVSALAVRYPGTLKAVELFPGANTYDGWGAVPSAAGYVDMFRAVKMSLDSLNEPVLLVAAGVRQLTDRPLPGDINDLVFLQSLYALGVASLTPVISMQYSDLSSVPLAFPDSKDQHVLRHYEHVRRVMVENGQQNGLLWITRIRPPSGKIEVTDSANQDENLQSNWMSLAYIQLRSQLYLGVMIGQSLNPGPGGTGAGVLSMISNAGDQHPFYSVLREMISLNKTGSVSIMPGRAKEGNLLKQRP